MKNVFNLFVIAICSILIVVSCRDNHNLEHGINCDPTELLFPLGGGEKMVLLTSDAAWSTTTNEDWVIVSPSFGQGSAFIKVTCLNGNVSEAKINFSTRKETATLVVKREILKVHVQPVDLGLPSGLKWANMNIGATRPEEFGAYFAWGETSPKNTYNWDTYKWCNGTQETLTKYNINKKFGYNNMNDGKKILDPEDDAAHVNWGGNWRMPNISEQIELLKNCTWTMVANYNGTNVDGYLVTSKKNCNSIFLPAAGVYHGASLDKVGISGYYWSASLLNPDTYLAYTLIYKSWYQDSRCYGQTIRPVCY